MMGGDYNEVHVHLRRHELSTLPKVQPLLGLSVALCKRCPRFSYDVAFGSVRRAR